jgi:hypothetical protein
LIVSISGWSYFLFQKHMILEQFWSPGALRRSSPFGTNKPILAAEHLAGGIPHLTRISARQWFSSLPALEKTTERAGHKILGDAGWPATPASQHALPM